MRHGTLAFATGAGAVSLAALAVLLAAGSSGWAAAAWVAMAIPAVVTGTRLASLHGRADARFVVVAGAGGFARLMAGALVTILAAREGNDAVRSALLGLAAGFVPVTVFEAAWFLRRKSAAPAAEGRA